MSRAQRRAMIATRTGGSASAAERHGVASVLGAPEVTAAREILPQDTRTRLIMSALPDAIDDLSPRVVEEVVEKHLRAYVEATVVAMLRGEVMTEIVREAVRLQIYSIATGEALSRVPEITARVRALVEETIDARVRSLVDKAVEGAVADVKRRLG